MACHWQPWSAIALGAFAHGLEADSVPNHIIGLFPWVTAYVSNFCNDCVAKLCYSCWATRELADVMLICITWLFLAPPLVESGQAPLKISRQVRCCCHCLAGSWEPVVSGTIPVDKGVVLLWY